MFKGLILSIFMLLSFFFLIVISSTTITIANIYKPQSIAYSISTGEWNWVKRADIATKWFQRMGYRIDNTAINPSLEDIKSIQNASVLFIIAHGSWGYFDFGNYTLWYFNISELLDHQLRFVFLHGCESMCEQGEETLSYQFRKGLNKNTAVVGSCGFQTEEGDECWNISYEWIDTFFNYTSQGLTVKESLTRTNEDYPVCKGIYRFEGDENLRLNLY